MHSSDSATIVVTDHSCLKNLTSSKTFENKRLNRYAVELSEHNLKIIYRKGADHHLSDLLSRMSGVTPCSVEAKRLGDEAAGCTAPLPFNSKCNVGTAANKYSSHLALHSDALLQQWQPLSFRKEGQPKRSLVRWSEASTQRILTLVISMKLHCGTFMI